MLVLTRKCGEQIVIGNDVTVEVMEIRGDKVRLGVVAPNSVSVHRKEVKDKINKEMEEHFKRRADLEANVEECE